LVHGIIIGTQAVIAPAKRGHLIGDVAALIGVVNTSRKLSKNTDKEDSNIAVKRLDL
jgi:hypothetical protein